MTTTAAPAATTTDECASHDDMSWCDVHHSRWRWDEDDCEAKIERDDPRT